MANELQIALSADFSTVNAATSFASTISNYVSGRAYANGSQDIETTATAINFQGISEPGYYILQNQDPNNLIYIGWIDSASVKIFPVCLPPGSGSQPGGFCVIFNNSYTSIWAKMVVGGLSTNTTAKLGIVAFDQMNTAAAKGIITLSVTQIPNDNTTTATVTVTLVSAVGAPVSGKTVTLTSSRSSGDTITTVSGTSSASGQATFTVKSTTIGLMELTAENTTDSVTLVAKGLLEVITA